MNGGGATTTGRRRCVSRELHGDHAAFRAFLTPVIASLAQYQGGAVRHPDC